MTKYFRDTTGMYVDWDQLNKLPEINTLVDIGVGPMGHQSYMRNLILLNYF